MGAVQVLGFNRLLYRTTVLAIGYCRFLSVCLSAACERRRITAKKMSSIARPRPMVTAA